jgi:hypothetical protein
MSDEIDVGIEIVVMNAQSKEASETELKELVGRHSGQPAFPVVLMGVAP